MKPFSLLSLTMTVAFSATVLFAHAAGNTSQSGAGNTSQTEASGASADANNSMSEGEIRKVDKDAGKITIKHGELKNLGMPPMTMVFRARDPAMLDQVKTGDKVSFVAEKVGGQFTVTKIEVKK